MTDTSSQKRYRRRFAARAAASFALAGAMVVAPLVATSAQAFPWGEPIFSNCQSKIVQLTFYVSGGPVQIGYNQNVDGVGNYPAWTLNAGKRTVNTGEHSIWWSVWSSTGTVTKWSKACVNYL